MYTDAELREMLQTNLNNGVNCSSFPGFSVFAIKITNGFLVFGPELEFDGKIFLIHVPSGIYNIYDSRCSKTYITPEDVSNMLEIAESNNALN